jgi:hypothetical protein
MEKLREIQRKNPAGNGNLPFRISRAHKMFDFADDTNSNLTQK